MSRLGLSLSTFTLWAALAPGLGLAQIQSRAHAVPGIDAAGNAQTVEAALHQSADRAAVIFVGSVAEVRRSTSGGLGSGIVEIRFNVEQAIRGCSGSSYTLREWGGLWIANDTRYRPGQHLLMLLHAPGATGLSSPVGGTDGAIPLRATGSGVTSRDTATAAPSDRVADLRWVGARLARTVSYRNATASAATRIHGISSAAQTAASSTTPATTSSSTAAQEAALTNVVAMIRSWEADRATR